MLSRAAVIWGLDWGCGGCFHSGSLTWLGRESLCMGRLLLLTARRRALPGVGVPQDPGGNFGAFEHLVLEVTRCHFFWGLLAMQGQPWSGVRVDKGRVRVPGGGRCGRGLADRCFCHLYLVTPDNVLSTYTHSLANSRAWRP